MDTTLKLLLAALAAGGSYGVLEPHIEQLVNGAKMQLEVIERTNKSETLKAAVVLYQVQNATSVTPTPKELVDAGYLDPKFLDGEQK